MYKKKIEQYIEAHKQEMLDDICTLCSINSERSAYQEGDPFGEGPSAHWHRHSKWRKSMDFPSTITIIM